MRKGLGRTLLVCTLVLAMAVPLFAQDWRIWEPGNGVSIRQGLHVEWYRSMAENSEGYLCVVWSDTRDEGRDVYGQLIDPDGNHLWGEDGKALARGFGRQEDPNVCASYDENGDPDGWIVSWIDYRWDYEIRDVGDVFIQKFDEDGEPQWQYEDEEPITGVPVTIASGHQIGVQVFTDFVGGGIAMWVDMRNGDADIYAQRIDADGNVADGWPDEGDPASIDQCLKVGGGMDNQGNESGGGYTGDSDGLGGVIIGWVDDRDAQNKDLYANRVSRGGELLWDESNEHGGLPIVTAPQEQGSFKMCPDGMGGGFFTWVDKRPGIDHQGDLYTQHVNAEGDILWGENGQVLCDAVEKQEKQRMVNTAPGEFITVWDDFRTDIVNSDLYVQRVSDNDNGDGPQLHWGEGTDGMLLCDAFRNQKEARLYPDGRGGAVIVWTDERFNESPREDLYANRLDIDGNKVWDDGNGMIVSDADLQQTGNIVRQMGDNTMAIVWFDYRRGSPGLYLQRYDIDTGDELGDEGGDLIVYGLEFNAHNPQPLYKGGSDVFIGFEDGRMGTWGKYAYLQKVDYETGEIQFQRNGINLTPGYPFTDGDTSLVNVDSVNYAMNDNGEVFAAWMDTRYGHFEIVAAQKIDSEGNLLWGDCGVEVAEPVGWQDETQQSTPKILPADDGGLFVIFMKLIPDDYYQNIVIQKISSDGEAMWTGDDFNGRLVTDAEYDHVLEDISYFDNGNILVVFNRNVDVGDYDVFAQCVDQQGNMVWDEPVGLAQIEDSFQHKARAASVQDGILVIWKDERRGAPINDLYGQIIYPDGSFEWEVDNGLALVAEDGGQSKVSIGTIGTDAQDFWIAWQDERVAEDPNIYAQRFNLDGESITDQILLTDDPPDTLKEQKAPKVVAGMEGDAYVIWEHAEGQFYIDLRYTHLDAEGEPYDDAYAEGLVLCDAYHQQILVKATSDLEGGFIATWEDLRSTGKEFLYNIYAQRVDDQYTVVSDRRSARPGEWELNAAYPNPFNPTTRINFKVGKAANVRLVIYDILGRRVKEVVNRYMQTGQYQAVWDGTDTNGIPVASGSYFYRLEADGVRIAKNVILLK